MKFTTTKSALEMQLKRVKQLVGKGPLPILQCVVLEAINDAEGVTLTTSNIEQTMIARVGAKEVEPGATAVDCRALLGMIGGLPDDMLTFTLEGSVVHITAMNTNMTIDGEDVEEFPPTPLLPEDAEKVDVNTALLFKALDAVLPGVATEDSRPVLETVNFDVHEESVNLVSADGFRLTVASIPKTDLPIAASVLVDGKALGIARKVIDGGEELTWTMGAEGVVKLESHALEMYITRTLGTFPNYSQLVPSEWTAEVTLRRDPFLEAVELAGKVAGGNPVKLIFVAHGEDRDGMLTVKGRVEGLGFETKVPATLKVSKGAVPYWGTEESKHPEYSGPFIATNGEYMADAIKAVPGDVVTFRVTSPSSPVVYISPHAPDPFAVVMPVFVQW